MARPGALRSQRVEESDDLEDVLPACGFRGTDPTESREQLRLTRNALSRPVDEVVDELRGPEAGIVQRAPGLTQRQPQ